MKVKRFLAMILALCMILSMAACGGNNSGTTKASGGQDTDASGGQKDTDKTKMEETPGQSSQAAVIDMDEEPYTVAIQVVTLPGTEFAGQEEREAAINAITMPAINCKVDIQEVWISEIANTTSMAVAGNEKIDIIHVATVNPLSGLVGSDILLDMNENDLLQSHGQDLIALFGDLIQCGNVDGRQLAIPAKTFNAVTKGIDYNKTVADECGIVIPDKITLDDLDTILYEVKTKKPDILPFYMGSGQLNYLYWLVGYEGFGSEASYGAVMDSSKKLEVENLYETELFRDYCLMTYRWKQDGIIPGDPTDTITAQAYMNAGQLFMGVADFNEKKKVEVATKYPFEVGWAEISPSKVTNSSITEYMWGIASSCERPDKAMDFLNFLYKNAEVANILKYGLEGVNYDFVDGSHKIIEINNSYRPEFYVGGDESQLLIQAPAGEDYNEKCLAEVNASVISPICNYMFDDTEFQTESSLIYSTILEYLPRLQNGMCESEEATLALLDEFNQKLKLAGIEDVIKANQEQLDAFLAQQ